MKTWSLSFIYLRESKTEGQKEPRCSFTSSGDGGVQRTGHFFPVSPGVVYIYIYFSSSFRGCVSAGWRRVKPTQELNLSTCESTVLQGPRWQSAFGGGAHFSSLSPSWVCAGPLPSTGTVLRSTITPQRASDRAEHSVKHTVDHASRLRQMTRDDLMARSWWRPKLGKVLCCVRATHTHTQRRDPGFYSFGGKCVVWKKKVLTSQLTLKNLYNIWFMFPLNLQSFLWRRRLHIKY